MSKHEIVLGLVVLASAAAGCGLGGDPKWPVPPGLSVEQEIELGRALAPLLEADLGGRLDDPAVQAYVRTVGERVARSTPLHALPYHFSVLAADAPGAFALPGGPAYVTRGLLAKLGSEGELAAALASELAHINARQVGQELATKFGAAALAEAIPGPVPDNRPATATRKVKLARIAAAVRQLRYDATTESEADRLGLDYLAAAGYNPASMVRLLAATSVADPDGRAEAIREMIARKYVDRGGRVGRQEYASEVLDRLKSVPPVSPSGASNGGSS